MSLRKCTRGAYILSGAVVLLLVPILLATVAPILAPIPTQAIGWTAPPLPVRQELLPSFQHLLEPLPLLARNLPDGESQQVAAAYDAAILMNHETVQVFLEAAKRAVPVPDDLFGEWEAWLSAMMDGERWGESAQIPFSILSALENDENNADRLNNLALAIYYWQISMPSEEGNVIGWLANGPTQYKILALLQSIRTTFPDTRSATLNFVAISHRVSGVYIGLENSDVVLNDWVSRHPDDTLVYPVLLRAYAYSHYRADFERVVVADTIREHLRNLILSPDPAHAALGHALLGDLNLLEAPSEPYALRQALLEALREYDLALELSDDASIYIARAMALEKLGDIHAAIEAQERSLQIAPESITVRVRLAQLLFQRRGSEAEILEDVRRARELSQDAFALVDESDGLPLSGVEIRLLDNTGLIGYAWLRPERYFVILGPIHGGAAAAVVSFDSIPIFHDIPWLVEPGKLDMESPLGWATGYALLSSIVLGDAESAATDLINLTNAKNSSRWHFDSRLTSAETAIVASEVTSGNSKHANDDFYFQSIFLASDAARYAGLPGSASAICRLALNGPEYRGKDVEKLGTCIAEGAYLSGDYELAKQAYESIGNNLMAGYVAERQGNQNEAEKWYRRSIVDNIPDSYLATVRLADMTIERDPKAAIEAYDRAIVWVTEPGGCKAETCTPVREKLPLIYNNRGVARLQMSLQNGEIDCEGDSWVACNAAFLDFEKALESDRANPVFLMNQAWVARLLGDGPLSAALMDRAAGSDTTLYPVLNDLGVFAASSGNKATAKQRFRDALAANPDYDLAWWNLGVLQMQDGFRGLLRGQAYLARAIIQSPSLITQRLEFLTDERIYRVEINENLRPGSTWSFGAASSIAATAFSLLTLVMVILYATYAVGLNKLQDTIMVRVNSSSKQLSALMPRHLPILSRIQRFRQLPIALALVVLTLTSVWVARSSEPNAVAASIAMALFAVLLAVVTHDAGHRVVARRMQVGLEPAQWAPGTVLAILLLPLGLSSGPYPSQLVIADDDRRAAWVSLAGPVANLAVAVAAYVLFSLQPLPFLRLIAQVQLAAMGYALLPFVPLDGAILGRAHPRILGAMSGAGLLFGVMLTLGML